MELSPSHKVTGIVLIILIGLLNFHLPHFLMESKGDFHTVDYFLEFFLLMIFFTSLFAAYRIYKNQRSGWIIGIAISILFFITYLLQETTGLPGLPKMWLEPSRILSVIIEIIFVILSRKSLKN